MQIKNLKLTDGRQLISNIVETDSTIMMLKDPLLVHVGLNEAKKPQIHLVPYMIEPGKDGVIELKLSSIEAQSNASIELETYYMQQTSGIDLTTTLK